MNKIVLNLILFAIIILSGCTKEEGEGGSSKIIGKLLIKEYSEDFSVLRDSYYAQGEDVYIVYGDDITYGDDMETNYDGVFQFNYLRKGKYTIYAYSKDSTGESLSGDQPVKIEVEIEKSGEIVDIGELVICETSDNNDGTSTITGKIYAYDYNSDFTIFNGEYYAPDIDVFLVYENDNYYTEDVETHYDGTYRFINLPKGNYKIYAYTRDVSGDTLAGVYPVFKEISITENYQEIIVEDLLVIN